MSGLQYCFHGHLPAANVFVLDFSKLFLDISQSSVSSIMEPVDE